MLNQDLYLCYYKTNGDESIQLDLFEIAPLVLEQVCYGDSSLYEIYHGINSEMIGIRNLNGLFGRWMQQEESISKDVQATCTMLGAISLKDVENYLIENDIINDIKLNEEEKIAFMMGFVEKSVDIKKGRTLNRKIKNFNNSIS